MVGPEYFLFTYIFDKGNDLGKQTTSQIDI